MSKKNVSGFVSALGALLDFVIRLMAAFTKLGGTDEQFHELITGKKSEEFINQVVNLAMKSVDTVRDGLRIVVDYSRSLAKMIEAGNYDWVHSNITDKHFPVKGSGLVGLATEIIYYGKHVSSSDIIKDLDSRGLRPATLAELAAFGEIYPDKQREFSIAALGSVWHRDDNGHDYVACLYSDAPYRSLNLSHWDGLWQSEYRFLAIRK
jgi:hypothetical protein